MDPRSVSTAGVSRFGIPLLFVLGALFQYLGAAVGVFLFETVDPAAVAWLRALGAAVVLLVWRLVAMASNRATRSRWTVRRVLTASGFGAATVGMNVMFYEAIDRIPLGAAVAIEFLGPIGVAAAGSRRPRDVLALILVCIGVLAIAGAQFDGDGFEIAGVCFALASATLWATYIVLGKLVADAGNSFDDLAIGFTVAAIVLAPILIGPTVAHDPGIFARADVWVLGLGVGLLSSVIPYVLDQVVLRRVGRAQFALLLALLPTTATVIGAVVLTQLPSPIEGLGIALVVSAVIVGSTRTVGRARALDAPPP